MKTLLLSVAAAVVLAGPVQAAPILVVTEPVRSERVSVADLNLNSLAGQARLEGRLRAAAEKVCEADGDRSLETVLNVRKCYSAAVAAAIRQGDDLVDAQASLNARGR